MRRPPQPYLGLLYSFRSIMNPELQEDFDSRLAVLLANDERHHELFENFERMPPFDEFEVIMDIRLKHPTKTRRLAAIRKSRSKPAFTEIVTTEDEIRARAWGIRLD